MRLFIGIALPDNVQRELVRVQQALKDGGSVGRWVPEGNHHITLQFLGETDALAFAADAMRQAVRSIRPFSLHLSGLDRFDRGIAIALVDGDIGELNALHESLSSELSDRGFARDYKRFSPHITLARAFEPGASGALESAVLKPGASFLVNAVHLFESRRIDTQMRYFSLHKETF
ncbi:MAG: RNA 2',3'-cyclic phosphodiesterase [Bacillota bacterium]